MFTKRADDIQAARAWYEGPAARLWQRREAAVLARILPRLTGYRCVTLGPPAVRAAGGPAATLRRWQGDVCAAPGIDFVYDGQSLPLASHSVDVLVLRHALELSSAPHRLVHECARVLSERGQLVCLVFNPASWWALGQRFIPRAQRFTCRAPVPRAGRLADWLRLFEFTATETWRYGPGFPLFSRCWAIGEATPVLAPIAWSAGGYALVARRRALRRIPPGGRRVGAKTTPAGLARPAGSGLTSAR